MTEDRPAVVTDEHLEYLDNLRHTSLTDAEKREMLVYEFGLSQAEADELITFWYQK